MTEAVSLKSGDPVPSVAFKIRQDEAWAERTSDEIFKGRAIVVFALPGAFTPTCSSTHLPGYVALAPRLQEAGIDEICCLSVNDSFVMNAWAEAQGVQGAITMLPDGNGDFSEGMGMLVDRSALGFGHRSWRYSMLVRDGVVEKVFEEDRDDTGDPFEVSDAQGMLDYLSKAPVSA